MKEAADMTDRHDDAARDLVQRAHNNDPEPADFDVKAGLADVLTRSGQLVPSRAQPAVGSTRPSVQADPTRGDDPAQSHSYGHGDDRLSGRRHNPASTDPDVQSEYERDVDRIHYNHYFLRLAEMTQVSSGQYRALGHNRMTHSLKVAQVGRRLVQYLERQRRNAVGISAAKGIDRDVVT